MVFLKGASYGTLSFYGFQDFDLFHKRACHFTQESKNDFLLAGKSFFDSLFLV